MGNNENFGHGGKITMRGDRKVVMCIKYVGSQEEFPGTAVEALTALFPGLARVDDRLFELTLGKEITWNDYKMYQGKVAEYSFGTGYSVELSFRDSSNETDIDAIFKRNEKALNDPEAHLRDYLPPVQTHVPMPPVQPSKLDPEIIMGRHSSLDRPIVVGSQIIFQIEVFNNPRSKDMLEKVLQELPGTSQYGESVLVHVGAELAEEERTSILNYLDGINKEFAGGIMVKIFDPFIKGSPKHLSIKVSSSSPETVAAIKSMFPNVVQRIDGEWIANIEHISEEEVEHRLIALQDKVQPWNTTVERKVESKAFGSGHLFNRFLTGDRLQIPPRPNGPEHKRQNVLRAAISANKDVSTEEAIALLSRQVESVDPTGKGDLKDDVTIKALGALERVQRERRKTIVRKRVRNILLLLLLVAVGVLGYFNQQLGLADYVFKRGQSTLEGKCVVPFGDSKLSGQRFRTYEHHSFLGWRMSSETPVREITELNLPGDQITVLGINPETGKWWRKSHNKNETQVIQLRPTDLYWFVGGKADQTAVVSYENFCN